MVPLIVLLVAGTGARIVGWAGVHYVDGAGAAIAVGLAAMFMTTGMAHFAPSMRKDLIAIVPPRLPAPGLLVTVTGLLELLGGAGLLFPSTRVAAAAALLLLLITMFPANVYAASMPNPPETMTTRLPLRTAAQVIYLAAAAVVIGAN